MTTPTKIPAVIRAIRPWSYSRYTAFRDCMHRGYLGYVLKLKGQETEAMKAGNLKHKILAAFITKAKIVGLEPGDDDKAAWERVRQMVSPNFKAETFLAVDEEMRPVDSNNRGSRFLLGIVDATNCSNLAVDWKTGSSLYYDELQAKFYAPLLAAWYKMQYPFYFSFIYPYSDMHLPQAPGKNFIWESRARIDAIFEELKAQVLDMEENIGDRDPAKANEWEPNVGSCKFCNYWAHCKHYNAPFESSPGVPARTFPTELTVTNAPAAALFVLQLDELLGKCKATLKAHCSEHGEITLADGRKYGLYEKTSRTVLDVRGLIRALKDAGMSLDDLWEKLTLAPQKAFSLGKKSGVDISPFMGEKISKACGLIGGNDDEG